MDERERFGWFLGIDVSKETFDGCCINSQGEKLFSLSTSMDRKGFEELISQLSSLSVSQESVLVGMESTACYHVNLYSFLASSGYCVIVINPLLISNFVKLQLRKTKTDKKDAYVIAQFMLLNRDSLCRTLGPSELSDIRDLSRQRESLVDQMTAIKSDIKRLLNITFPELGQIAGVFTKSMLRLLCQYPSAASMRQAKRSKIAKLLIPGSYGKQTRASVERIIKTAEVSIGTASPAREIIVKQKVSLLMQLEEHLQELTKILVEHCDRKMKRDMDILTSMKGIGERTAMNFLIEIGGDIKQFESHKKVIAMAGLDPALYQSGKIDRKGKISKRGNRCSDVTRQTDLEKYLYAIDELTGLVAPTALIRPSKSVLDVQVKSVKNKWKDKRFPAGVNRSVIEKGAEMLDVELDELIDDTIKGMQEVAETIDLKGNPS